MHFLTKLSLYNRWITVLLAIALIGVSLWATLRMKQEMIPDIEFPMTTVMTVYPGASPQTVLDEATVPVEQALKGMDGLKQTSSTSVQSMSVVMAEFEYGTNMDKVNERIEQKLKEIELPDAARGEIAEGQTSPIVYPLNVSMIPIVMYSLSSEDLDPNELYSIVTSEVVPALSEGNEDKYLVSVEGGQDNVVVTPDAAKMNARNIPMAELLLALEGNQYLSEDEVLDAPVASSVRVRDVASVATGPAPQTAVTRTNGETSIIVLVQKLPEANTVDVAKVVNTRMKEIDSTLEENVTFIKAFDQSDFIKESIGELTQDALLGGILAVIVIFIFLLTVRGSLVIALSIPFSIFVGFLIMSAVGVTINILTLGAMTIAVGRIVDDSIVMLEVIYRRLRQGQPFKQAALEGSREVAMPIVSATIATVAIFIPLAFVGGIVGEMFIPFAETITFALLGSLLIALTVVPALCGILVPKTIRPESENAWYQRLYLPALKWALAHRVLTVVVAVALFGGSLALLPVIGTSFMPSMGIKEVFVDVEMPLGTDIKTTSAKTLEVEKVIKDAMDSGDSEIDGFYTTVGTSSSFAGAFASLGGGGGTSTATIEILLKKNAHMNREVDYLQERIDAAVGGEGKITVSPMSASMGSFDPNSFMVYLTSDNYSNVVDAANRLTMLLDENVKGLETIEADIAVTIRQPSYTIDPMKVALQYQAQGLNPLQFQDQFKADFSAMLMGTPVTGASVDGTGLYVNGVVQTALSSPELLQNLLISGGMTDPVRFAAIADNVTIVSEPTNIKQIDGERTSTVSATVTKKDVGAVTSDAQKEIDSVESEFNVTASQGGVSEEMNKTFRDMGIAMIIAIVISFAIVVVSFRSFLSAILIMVSLPLASIGALLGLLVTGNTLGASGMMGMVMLVGIVLTNAIVLLALVDQLRKQGMNTYDALVIGGRTRIRPILMTAITTMVGLVPLALGYGQGILLASELAIVVLGGLVSSTLLTLIVVPVLYSLTDRFRRRATVKVTAADAATGKPTGA